MTRRRHRPNYTARRIIGAAILALALVGLATNGTRACSPPDMSVTR